MGNDGNPAASTPTRTKAGKPFAWRSPLHVLTALFAFWLLSFAAPALAAADVYRLYIASSATPATGCAATPPTRPFA